MLPFPASHGGSSCLQAAGRPCSLLPRSRTFAGSHVTQSVHRYEAEVSAAQVQATVPRCRDPSPHMHQTSPCDLSCHQPCSAGWSQSRAPHQETEDRDGRPPRRDAGRGSAGRQAAWHQEGWPVFPPGAAQAGSARKPPGQIPLENQRQQIGRSLGSLRVMGFPWNQEPSARCREKRPYVPCGLGTERRWVSGPERREPAVPLRRHPASLCRRELRECHVPQKIGRRC